MISKKEFVEMVRKKGKKIGKDALGEFDSRIRDFTKVLLESAVRNSEMGGRVMLKKEDFL
jgi:histone H3/H4